MTADEIAECLGMALSTVSRWLKRIGLGKRSRLEPPEPPNRYERKRPGELVHVDVKKLGRISRAGHRITGSPATAAPDRRPRRTGATGWEFVHVCVDDATRLAYVEVLADEKGETRSRLSAASRRVVQIDGDHRRAGDERQRRLLSLDRARARLPRARAQAPVHPALPARGPTARPSASSRRFKTAGPTEPSTAAPPSAPRPYPAGSPTTTSNDDMAPSAKKAPAARLAELEQRHG